MASGGDDSGELLFSTTSARVTSHSPKSKGWVVEKGAWVVEKGVFWGSFFGWG
jgi:hypothetical protein